MMDSGDSNCENVTGWGCIWPDQVEWYMQQSKQNRINGNPVPSLSFFRITPHCLAMAILFFYWFYWDIPLQEHMFLWNDEPCYGTNNDTVACQSVDTGLFAAFLEMGDVKVSLPPITSPRYES